MNTESMGTGMSGGPGGSGSKVPIYELARELGIPNKDLVTKIRALGIEAKNHMSRLDVEDASRVRRAIDKERQENTVQERLSDTVIRRRSKDGSMLHPPARPQTEPPRAAVPVPAPAVSFGPGAGVAPPVIVRKRAEAAPTQEVFAKAVRTARPREGAAEPGVQDEVRARAAVQAEPSPVQQAGEDALPGAVIERLVEGPPGRAAPVEEQRRQAAPALREGLEAPPPRVEQGLRPEPAPRVQEAPSAGTPAPRAAEQAPVMELGAAVHEEPARLDQASAIEGKRAEERVFVTAQTRRVHEGLGPTGRVIDLSALRPAVAPPPPVETRPQIPGRGPRQEVSGERLRQASRPQPQSRQQPPQKMRLPPGKKAKTTQITTAAEHKRVVKMGESIIINELARQMGLKATDLLKKIWELGMRNVMINSPIDFDTAQLVASEFEWRVESTAFQEASAFEDKADVPEDMRPRAPVITIMGHVDHGKTSLLDAIRNANVAAGEAGGITQHIGAYKVTGPSGDVVFLDTPGHEAFTEMRARGAQVTDIVVLVVAADDGVMPQTLEALNHARDAKVPIIVAVNKIDKPQAQPDRIRQQLSAHGLTPEEWGGETIYVDVSARTRAGIDKMLEMLALQSEVLELKANPKKAARGTVVEARMDPKRGPVATVLVLEGTLHIGDLVVVGEEFGKVRAMTDDKGQQVSEAGPATPVEILGLGGVPRAGEALNAVTAEAAAKELVEHRRQRRIEKERAKAGPVSLDRLMDAMKAGLKELKIILKADVQGSVEALTGSLTKLSTPQVKVTVIQSGVGGITESDVNLAKAGNAIIIGFHVRPAGKAAMLAEQEGVDIKLYDIIYEALDDVKKAMAGLLAPVKREKALGRAEVRRIFNIPRIGTVAGCAVVDGMIKRNAPCRLVRDSVQIYQGKLASLRRFKDDVREVQQGYECGMSIEGYNDVKVGDIIESYEIEEVAATLA